MALSGRSTKARSVRFAEGGETGKAEQDKARVDAEQQAWRAKLVVEDAKFYVSGRSAAKPGQVERYRGLLHGPPKKLALRLCHPEDVPVSIWQSTGRCAARGASGGVEQPEKFTVPRRDFVTAVAKEKRAVHKPGLSQSWDADMRVARVRARL